MRRRIQSLHLVVKLEGSSSFDLEVMSVFFFSQKLTMNGSMAGHSLAAVIYYAVYMGLNRLVIAAFKSNQFFVCLFFLSRT